MPCARSMRRLAVVSPNETSGRHTAKLGLQIWNASHSKILRAAYMQVIIRGIW